MSQSEELWVCLNAHSLRSGAIGHYFGSLQWRSICVWSAPIFWYLDGLLMSWVTLAIIHKRKLVQELMHRGFLTSHSTRWLANYGYLQYFWCGPEAMDRLGIFNLFQVCMIKRATFGLLTRLLLYILMSKIRAHQSTVERLQLNK